MRTSFHDHGMVMSSSIVVFRGYCSKKPYGEVLRITDWPAVSCQRWHHQYRNRGRTQYAICNGSGARPENTSVAGKTHHDGLHATVASDGANHFRRAAEDHNVIAASRATELPSQRLEIGSSGAKAHLVGFLDKRLALSWNRQWFDDMRQRQRRGPLRREIRGHLRCRYRRVAEIGCRQNL